MLTKKELPECPVAAAIQLIGNKWKLLIIRSLILKQVCRFGELQREIVGISQKVLTENLRALEGDGLIIRTAYPEVPPRVEYSLSDLGRSLLPVFSSLEEWASHYKSQLTE